MLLLTWQEFLLRVKLVCEAKLIWWEWLSVPLPCVSPLPPIWLWWAFVEHNPTLLYVRPLTNLSPRPSGLWIKGPFHLSSLDEWSSCLAAAQSPASPSGIRSRLVRLSHVWLTGSSLIGGRGIIGSLHWLKPRGDVLQTRPPPPPPAPWFCWSELWLDCISLIYSFLPAV